MTGPRPVRRGGLVLLSMIIGALWVSGTINAPEIHAALYSLIGIDPIDEFTASPAAAETAIHIELSESAKMAYGFTRERSQDKPYLPHVRRAGYTFDASLAHAAREVAEFYKQTRRLAPSGVLAFLLDSAGATFWGVRQTVVITTDHSIESINAVLDAPETDEDQWVIGIGETVVNDSPPLRIIVGLSAKQTIQMAPTPRRYTTGDIISLRGRTKAQYGKLFALAMGPAGEVESLSINSSEDGFSGQFTAAPGEWIVELIGTSRSGPLPLAQLTLHVNDPVPTTYSDVWPPHESQLSDPADYMLGLINRDRKLASLPPLKRIRSLDKVALAHSTDMKTNHFVGHVSPSTGSVGDRLNQQGVARLAHGENVALNNSVTDAHYGLMRSLGHRKNLLSPGFSEVGIGLISSRNGWYVTQVFSKPTETTAALNIPASTTQSASMVKRYGALAN